MKKYRIADLKETKGEHFLSDLAKGKKLVKGGVHFYNPAEYSHPEGIHIHEDVEEVFICIQGKAKAIVDDVEHDFNMGDIVIIEPGEEHHIRADKVDPIVNLWLEA